MTENRKKNNKNLSSPPAPLSSDPLSSLSSDLSPLSSDPLIVCENLVKIYQVADLEVVALQGLDLVVNQGELLGIVGASGSGKTTLMNILGGLDRPSAGRVWVDGRDLLKISDAALDRYRRTRVGFVWQQSARNLIPYLNARENVELPMTLAGRVGRNKRRRAEELLEVVGLAERQKHRLPELSGGEQQRVAIAVALANNPALLLADEPTGEVDSVTALSIYQTFQNLSRHFNLTTLIVSHDQEIARHVDRVVAIRDGKTASETIRQSSADFASPGGDRTAGDGSQADEIFEELAVLDSAGRLQLPKEFLEQFSIKGRARLEATEDGILIRPARNSGQQKAADAPAAEQEPKSEPGGLRGLLNRWRRSKD